MHSSAWEASGFCEQRKNSTLPIRNVIQETTQSCPPRLELLGAIAVSLSLPPKWDLSQTCLCSQSLSLWCYREPIVPSAFSVSSMPLSCSLLGGVVT